MAASGSTYPDPFGPRHRQLVDFKGLTGKPETLTPASVADDDPDARTGAVLQMMERWDVININVGGTNTLRFNAERIVPREPSEDDDAYRRRIFHSVLPPYVQRLAAQATGTILRRGVHLEGGDEEYWREWAEDVTGDGTPLNEFCRKTLVDALLYGHSSVIVDFDAGAAPATLAEEVALNRKPYLTCINAQQIRGWRTVGNRSQAPLTQVRYHEVVSIPEGQFGEELVEQIVVLTPIGYQRWRKQSPRVQANAGWEMVEEGTHTAGEIPFVTVYSNRLATLYSKPPLEEVAHLSVAYAQRFTDYMNSLHVGSMPMLTLKGFDPDIGQESLGLSVNKAILLPTDGEASIVSPPSDSYQEQLRCLTTLEEQISSLGISALAKQNITNTAAESKRLDRIDSDSIMSIISQDLERAVGDILRIAGKYVGKEPPKVTIPKDYENRLLDGNQITAMLQLQMQNQISQSTLLRILKEGEVIPPYVDVDEEILRTKDEMDADLENELKEAQAFQELELEAAEKNEGGVTSGDAADGSATGSNTLPTPLRPGKHAD